MPRTFADLVRELPIRVTGQGRIIPTVMSRKQFTDEAGTSWRRRGNEYLDGKGLEKRLLDPRVAVMHEYMGRLNAISPEERAEFWAHPQQSMETSSYSDFYGAEFKNADGQYLLVIHEDC